MQNIVPIGFSRAWNKFTCNAARYLLNVRHYSALEVTHPSPPSLRPYQEECITSIFNSLNRKVRPAVSLPTGSGKTRIFSHILKDVKCMYPEDAPKRSKILVIVNRKELLDQAMKSIRNMHTNMGVGCVYGSTDPDPSDQVVVATYQTLVSRDRMKDLDPDEFKLIIIDEAHHSAASSYVKILEHFEAIGPRIENQVHKPDIFEESESFENEEGTGISLVETDVAEDEQAREDNPNRRVHVIGFSATFWRSDKKILANIYDEVCYHESMEMMVKNGFLCPGKMTSVTLNSAGANYNLEKFRDDTGRLRASDFFTSSEGVELIYDTWAGNSDRERTVLFGTSMKHLKDINDKFAEMGVDSRIIHAKMKKKDRQALIDAFSAGEFPVMLNCQILTEGTDIPAIDQIIIARGIKSKGMFMQMIGRGLRLSPTKNDCNIVIFQDFHSFDGLFLPQLFKEKSFKNPDGTPAKPPSDDKKKLAISESIDYSSVLIDEKGEFSFEMVTASNYKPLHPKQSIFRWLNVKRKYYLFPMNENYYYTVMKIGDMWCCKRTVRIAKNYKQVKELIKSSSLGEVISFTDMQLKSSRFRLAMLKDAKWRGAKITAEQAKVLADIIKILGPDFHLNRGLATDLISLKLLGIKLSRELVTSLSGT